MSQVKEILKVIQNQNTQKEKTTRKPIYKKKIVREKFLFRLNEKCLESSNGKNGLILNKEMEFAIELMCMYINNEPEFETVHGFSFKKGMWFYGNCGSGKTLIMSVYRDMKIKMGHKIGMVSCGDVNTAFSKRNEQSGKLEGFKAIKSYVNKADKVERVFDDLGEEDAYVFDFSAKYCVMAHILNERNKGMNVSGVKTHITTNLSSKDVEEIYGGRIESRSHKMFNMVKLGSLKDSVDYRKF